MYCSAVGVLIMNIIMNNKLYKVVGYVLDDNGEYTRIELTNNRRGHTYPNALCIAELLKIEHPEIEGVTIQEFKK